MLQAVVQRGAARFLVRQVVWTSGTSARARPPGKRGGAPARTARADLADSHISSSNPRATNKLAMKRPLKAENSGARSVATSYSACAGLDDGSGFVHHGPLFAYFKGSTFSTAVWQNN